MKEEKTNWKVQNNNEMEDMSQIGETKTHT